MPELRESFKIFMTNAVEEYFRQHGLDFSELIVEEEQAFSLRYLGSQFYFHCGIERGKTYFRVCSKWWDTDSNNVCECIIMFSSKDGKTSYRFCDELNYYLRNMALQFALDNNLYEQLYRFVEWYVRRELFDIREYYQFYNLFNKILNSKDGIKYADMLLSNLSNQAMLHIVNHWFEIEKTESTEIMAYMLNKKHMLSGYSESEDMKL